MNHEYVTGKTTKRANRFAGESLSLNSMVKKKEVGEAS